MSEGQERAEATDHDALAFCQIKEDAFDEDDFIKSSSKDQFVPAPCGPIPGVPGPQEFPDHSPVLHTRDEINILEDHHHTFSEQFEEGVAILRKHVRVCTLFTL